ncbi:MAG: hypothetical protein V4864_12580 [Pseudomonadota bacterium]
MQEILDLLLAAPGDPVRCESLSDWMPAWVASQARHAAHGPFAGNIAAASGADRLAWAFFSGYQGAIQAAFGARVAPGTASSLCVSEAGRGITDMATVLQRSGDALLLQGSKSWVLADLPGLTLFVLARDPQGPAKGPGSMRMVQLPLGAAGVRCSASRPQAIIPELPHAALAFDAVRVDPAQCLPGDGYADHAKPFRLREDLFVTGAALAYLLAEAKVGGWPTVWCQRCIAAIGGLASCAALDARDTRIHILAAGALAFAGDVLRESEQHWTSGQADARDRWHRDGPVLALGEDARRQRALKAWAGVPWKVDAGA